MTDRLMVGIQRTGWRRSLATESTPGKISWFPIAADLRRYSLDTGRHDLVAGLTVALFAIPQAMAYALIAGFPPSAGIVGAAVAAILGSIFGSSAFLISGPTNAISVMLAANAVTFAVYGDPLLVAVTVTMMIGVVQFGAAFFKLGRFTRFVSEPVLTGFTAGAGIYIAVNQLPSVLGVARNEIVRDVWGLTLPHNCLFDFFAILLTLEKTNRVALMVGASTFFLVRGLQRLEPHIQRRLPAPFLAVLTVTLGAWLLKLGEPERGALKLKLVKDIEPIARRLPDLVLPSVSLDEIQSLIGAVIAIAILGAVEAIAISKILADKAGHRFDANQELMGQGLCNIGVSLVGGFASSGSFTRSAVNYDSGAATRVSGVLSGILVMGIVVLFAPAANYIPTAVLAGTLIHIGLKLVDVGRMRLHFATTHADRWVLLTTFGGVLLVSHLEVALFLGIALAIGLALKRAEGFKMSQLVETDNAFTLEEIPLTDKPCGVVAVIDLKGEMFFAAAEEFEHRLRFVLEGETRFVVLRVAQALNMDVTCVESLVKIAKLTQSLGGQLILSGVRPGMYGTFVRAGLVKRLGEENVFAHDGVVLGGTLRAFRRAKALAEAHRQAQDGGKGPY